MHPTIPCRGLGRDSKDIHGGRKTPERECTYEASEANERGLNRF
jgi:hypothetical protein